MLPATGEQHVLQLQLQMQQLSKGLSQLSILQQGSHATSPQPLPLVPKPEKYETDPGKCLEFVLQCRLYFDAHAGMNDQIMFFNDNALSWATVLWQGNNTIDYEQFFTLFQSIFDNFTDGKEVSEKLLTLKQGSRRAADYYLDFCTLAANKFTNRSELT